MSVIFTGKRKGERERQTDIQRGCRQTDKTERDRQTYRGNVDRQIRQ